MKKEWLCNHCPTCHRWVKTIKQALQGSGRVWKWKFLAQGGMWLGLPCPDNQDPLKLLRSATGLNITT